MDERQRRVVEARMKEELKDEEKKKKIEQKMTQIDEKNDKVCILIALYCIICVCPKTELWFGFNPCLKDTSQVFHLGKLDNIYRCDHYPNP